MFVYVYLLQLVGDNTNFDCQYTENSADKECLEADHNAATDTDTDDNSQSDNKYSGDSLLMSGKL